MSNITEIKPVLKETDSDLVVTETTTRTSRKWTIEDAVELYNIDGWGMGYFAVNQEGNLSMLPTGQGGPQIDILDVVQEVERQKIELPCIIRFHDILRHRVEMLNQSFLSAIQEHSYEGKYRGVYPIKVNQMREVIEEIVDAGRPYSYGLEAGSKAELQVTLAYNQNPDALTICNGYKDAEYIRLALLGVQLGKKVVIVIEKFSELKLCLDIAKEVGVKPLLGIRAKLSSPGSGKWQESGGAHAKFGLNSAEILRAIDFLKEHEYLDCLKLFHFHIGSQIPDIRTIKSAVAEGARIYSSLYKLGAPIEYFDVGGGLGIDYDGSQSVSDFSINYTTGEYISDVVYQVKSICDDAEVPHPHLVSESGRAIAASHSCLIMKAIDSFHPGVKKDWDKSPYLETSDFVKEVYEVYKGLNLKNALESYHDAQTMAEQALTTFRLGHLTLGERAVVEQIVTEITNWISENKKRMKRIPDEFQQLSSKISKQYVVNFSVFQSAPDHWAFDQLFPIVPIHRMKEKPRNNAILVDITCDSDGEIDRFIDRKETYASQLKLHSLHPKKPYYLGMFLTGAYQDIMGDMHNLFGRVNEVHVFSDDDDPEDFYIEEVIRGDTISDTLVANQYSIAELCKMMKSQVDAGIKAGHFKPREGIQLLDFYTQVLQTYTYLRR